MIGFLDRFTDRARKAMALAKREADRVDQEYLPAEYILLGLIKEGTGVGLHVLKDLDVDIKRVVVEVEKHIANAPAASRADEWSALWTSKQVIAKAVEAARDLGHNYIGTEHLLLGLLKVDGAISAQVLREQDVTFEKARAALVLVLGMTDSPYYDDMFEHDDQDDAPEETPSAPPAARRRRWPQVLVLMMVAATLCIVLLSDRGCPTVGRASDIQYRRTMSRPTVGDGTGNRLIDRVQHLRILLT